MRVLGIDPGTSLVGFGCVELPTRQRRLPGMARVRNLVSNSNAGAPRLIDVGVLRLGRRGDPIESRLRALAAGVEEWVARLAPDILSLEEAFFGKSVQSALRIGESRGVVLLCAARAGLAVAQYAPATVKLRVAGSGRASKAALARMVETSLGHRVRGLPADATDALAVALCHGFAATWDDATHPPSERISQKPLDGM